MRSVRTRYGTPELPASYRAASGTWPRKVQQPDRCPHVQDPLGLNLKLERHSSGLPGLNYLADATWSKSNTALFTTSLSEAARSEFGGRLGWSESKRPRALENQDARTMSYRRTRLRPRTVIERTSSKHKQQHCNNINTSYRRVPLNWTQMGMEKNLVFSHIPQYFTQKIKEHNYFASFTYFSFVYFDFWYEKKIF